jgi:hypothetical protein
MFFECSQVTVNVMVTAEGRTEEIAAILREFEATAVNFLPRPAGTPNPNVDLQKKKERKQTYKSKINAYRRCTIH